MWGNFFVSYWIEFESFQSLSLSMLQKKLEFTSTLVFGRVVVVSSHVWRKIRLTNRNCQFPKFTFFPFQNNPNINVCQGTCFFYSKTHSDIFCHNFLRMEKVCYSKLIHQKRPSCFWTPLCVKCKLKLIGNLCAWNFFLPFRKQKSFVWWTLMSFGKR